MERRSGSASWSHISSLGAGSSKRSLSQIEGNQGDARQVAVLIASNEGGEALMTTSEPWDSHATPLPSFKRLRIDGIDGSLSAWQPGMSNQEASPEGYGGLSNNGTGNVDEKSHYWIHNAGVLPSFRAPSPRIHTFSEGKDAVSAITLEEHVRGTSRYANYGATGPLQIVDSSSYIPFNQLLGNLHRERRTRTHTGSTQIVSQVTYYPEEANASSSMSSISTSGVEDTGDRSWQQYPSSQPRRHAVTRKMLQTNSRLF